MAKLVVSSSSTVPVLAEQGLAASLDDGGGADPVLVEQAGRGEGVGQLAGPPGEDVAAFGLPESADVVERVGAAGSSDYWNAHSCGASM